MEWISVEDDLPEEQEHVLAIGNYLPFIARRIQTIVNNKPSKIIWVDSDVEECRVTHWMPLPPKP